MIDGDELQWQKARASIPDGNCVEIARLPGGGVAMRDSKDPSGPALHLEAAQWHSLKEFVLNHPDLSG